MGIAGPSLVPHLSKSGKSFLFHSCTSDDIVISQNSQWVKSCKNTQKPSSPGIQRFLARYALVFIVGLQNIQMWVLCTTIYGLLTNDNPVYVFYNFVRFLSAAL